jgi:hypothetical protein
MKKFFFSFFLEYIKDLFIFVFKKKIFLQPNGHARDETNIQKT